jgi:trehalose 6-phosphate phosphatase
VTEELLKPFLERPENAGVFLDFDGTLSEIVHVPSEARPVSGARRLLERLAARFALVSVVSGRSAHQLLEWLGDGIEIWGVHGTERAVDGRVEIIDAAAPFVELMTTVRSEASRRIGELDLPGVFVEDKGVMLALHFRAASDVETARRALDELAESLAAEHGLKRAGGRLAFELRPPLDVTKANIVLTRTREEKLSAAMFVGDDRVDIPAFEALDELAGEGVTTVRVAVDSSEAPAELLERADIVVNGPAGTMDLLRRLI